MAWQSRDGVQRGDSSEAALTKVVPFILKDSYSTERLDKLETTGSKDGPQKSPLDGSLKMLYTFSLLPRTLLGATFSIEWHSKWPHLQDRVRGGRVRALPGTGLPWVQWHARHSELWDWLMIRRTSIGGPWLLYSGRERPRHDVNMGYDCGGDEEHGRLIEVNDEGRGTRRRMPSRPVRQGPLTPFWHAPKGFPTNVWLHFHLPKTPARHTSCTPTSFNLFSRTFVEGFRPTVPPPTRR